MNLFEAGIIAGVPTGATIGGVICKSHGVLAIVGGSFAGLVSGAVVGWLYAFLVICLMSFIGVLWRAARKHSDAPPVEREMEMMTRTSTRGIIIGVLTSLVLWISFGWLYALVVALAIASVTAFIAVARCELR